MLAKYWKKIGLVILIIACIINIGYKIIRSTPLKEQLKIITDNFNSSENIENTTENDMQNLEEVGENETTENS